MRRLIVVVLLIVTTVSLIGCTKDTIEDVNENSKFLQELMINLHEKSDKKEIIVSKKQKGAEEVFKILGITEEQLESYVFKYTEEEYILIMRAESFQEESLLVGVMNLIEETTNEENFENLVFTSVGEYLVVIKHEKSEELQEIIETSLINWDTNVKPIL